MNAQTLAKTLHFEEALQANPSPLLKARCLRALCRYEEADDLLASLPDEPEVRLEKAKLLFATGKYESAHAVLSPLVSDLSLPFFPEAVYTLAALEAQTGNVKGALDTLEPLRDYDLSIPLAVDIAVLYGDLYTFQSDVAQAKTWYETALDRVSVSIPENWAPLRKALVLHNLADLYEQEEDWDKAVALYKSALDTFEKITDSAITDLAGAKLDLLLSLANCLANADRLQEAQSVLASARESFVANPPFLPETFRARLDYFAGLFALYADKPCVSFLSQAATSLKSLLETGLAKPEWFAKAAYYLAFALPDDDLTKLVWYGQALSIFSSLWEKEPVFYLDSMAQIHNEKGRLLQDPEEYRAAVTLYKQLLSLFPSEWFTLHSLLVTLLNLSDFDSSVLPEIESVLDSLCLADPGNADSYRAMVDAALAVS